MSYTTLEALKAFGGFEGDDEDVRLSAMIASATTIIENCTQRRFEVDSETDQDFTKVRGVESIILLSVQHYLIQMVTLFLFPI